MRDLRTNRCEGGAPGSPVARLRGIPRSRYRSIPAGRRSV